MKIVKHNLYVCISTEYLLTVSVDLSPLCPGPPAAAASSIVFYSDDYNFPRAEPITHLENTSRMQNIVFIIYWIKWSAGRIIMQNQYKAELYQTKSKFQEPNVTCFKHLDILRNLCRRVPSCLFKDYDNSNFPLQQATKRTETYGWRSIRGIRSTWHPVSLGLYWWVVLYKVLSISCHTVID